MPDTARPGREKAAAHQRGRAEGAPADLPELPFRLLKLPGARFAELLYEDEISLPGKSVPGEVTQTFRDEKGREATAREGTVGTATVVRKLEKRYPAHEGLGPHVVRLMEMYYELHAGFRSLQKACDQAVARAHAAEAELERAGRRKRE